MLKNAGHRIKGNRSSTNSSRHFLPPEGREGLKSGIPITDACVIEEFTERILRNGAEVLHNSGIEHPASHPSPRLTSPLRRHAMTRPDPMCVLEDPITAAMAVQLALGCTTTIIFPSALPHDYGYRRQGEE